MLFYLLLSLCGGLKRDFVFWCSFPIVGLGVFDKLLLCFCFRLTACKVGLFLCLLLWVSLKADAFLPSFVPVWWFIKRDCFSVSI